MCVDVWQREEKSCEKASVNGADMETRRAKKGWKEKITACHIERTSTDGNRKPEVHLARMQWPSKATARAMATGHIVCLMLMAWVAFWG